MLYRSKPCLSFFSAVVKNVASTNIEIKKLVYIFLLHHAELDPDMALLSINTIQKSLSDQNAQLRAMALRVMSGIRVPVISQIVSLAIKRGVADMSPVVRRAAALAIPKCFQLDPSTLPQLLEYLSSLLGDRQYFVAGPAVSAFLEICPERIDLIHKHYRALVRKLVDMDEWSQIATLRLLTYYSRRCFPRKTPRKGKQATKGSSVLRKDTTFDDELRADESTALDPDLEALLKASRSLLSSRNSAVIVAAVRCLTYLGGSADFTAAVGPLISLMRASKDVQSVALHDIVSLCMTRSDLFVKHVPRLLVKADDELDVSKLKFEALTLIFPCCEPHLQEMVLSELEHFARSNDPSMVEESVRAIGRCAQRTESISERCLSLLLHQISSRNGHLVAEALTVIRHLIQRHPEAHVDTVIRLAKNLDSMVDTQARASIIWLVSEYAGVPDNTNVAPDVLRILAKGFADEAEPAKLQIVLLAAKVYLQFLLQKRSQAIDDSLNQSNSLGLEGALSDDNLSEEAKTEETADVLSKNDQSSTIPLLWKYILHLTRYDVSYDLRDRARFYEALLDDANATQLASLVLLAPKPIPQAISPSAMHQHLLLGSSSRVLGVDAILGFENLPVWVMDGNEPNPKLREQSDVTVDSGRSAQVIPAALALDQAVKEKGLDASGPSSKGKNLQDWLDEESESEEDEGSTEYETESDQGNEERTEYESESESDSKEENKKLVA